MNFSTAVMTLVHKLIVSSNYVSVIELCHSQTDTTIHYVAGRGEVSDISPLPDKSPPDRSPP